MIRLFKSKKDSSVKGNDGVIDTKSWGDLKSRMRILKSISSLEDKLGGNYRDNHKNIQHGISSFRSTSMVSIPQ